jgi:hypothetical protein
MPVMLQQQQLLPLQILSQGRYTCSSDLAVDCQEDLEDTDLEDCRVGPLEDPREDHQADQDPSFGHVGPGGGGGSRSKLGGNPPAIFDGDRSKANNFMTEFNLYHITNL